MAISKVILGDQTLMDLTNDTVTADNLLEGYTAHGANGEPILGAATGGGGSTITVEETGTASATTCRWQQIVIDDVAYEIKGTRYMKIDSIAMNLDRNTVITFTNDAIKYDSIIDVYLSISYDISMDDIQITNGSCVITLFPSNFSGYFSCIIYIK